MRNGFTVRFGHFLGTKTNLKEKKNEKTFCLWKKATVNPLRKKKPVPKKTQIALLGHAPGFRSARENACPVGVGSLL